MFNKHLEELDDDFLDEEIEGSEESSKDSDGLEDLDDKDVKKKDKKSFFSFLKGKKKKKYLTEDDIQKAKKQISVKFVILLSFFSFLILVLIAIVITLKRSYNTKRVVVKIPKQQQTLKLIDNSDNLWKLQVDNQLHSLNTKLNKKIGEIKNVIKKENNITLNAVKNLIEKKVTNKINSIETQISQLKNQKQEILQEVKQENQQVLQQAKTYALQKSLELETKLSQLKPVNVSIKQNSSSSNAKTKHSNKNKPKSKIKKHKNTHKLYQQRVQEVEEEVANLNIENIPLDISVQKHLKQPHTQKKENIPYHLMTGFVKAILITGVSAPTFSAGLLNPKPVLLSVMGKAIIANDQNENIKNCLLIGKATGNMNTSRAEILITRISCSIPTNTPGVYKKIEAIGNPIGWVIGEDGKYGLRGRLVDSAGKVIVRQIMVGFLQGVSQAFAPSTILPVQTTTTNTLKNVQTALGSGISQGASNAFASLAQYYKKMLDGMYPYVDVMAGRKVTVLLKGFQNIRITKYRKVDVSKTGNNGYGEASYEVHINYDGF